MLTPTGAYNHPSHHEKAGQVPHMEATRVGRGWMAWFLNGYHSASGNYAVGKGDAESATR